MLELTPKDSRIIERGNYLFEIAPDGVSIKKKKSKEPITAKELINIGDWLAAIAYEVQERESYGTSL